MITLTISYMYVCCTDTGQLLGVYGEAVGVHGQVVSAG